MSHTPGPWKMGRNGKQSYRNIESSDNILIATCWPYGNVEDLLIANANAQLISAAPELLQVVKELLNSDIAMREEDEGNESKLLNKIRSMVAKAEGK